MEAVILSLGINNQNQNNEKATRRLLDTGTIRQRP